MVRRCVENHRLFVNTFREIRKGVGREEVF